MGVTLLHVPSCSPSNTQHPTMVACASVASRPGPTADTPPSRKTRPATLAAHKAPARRHRTPAPVVAGLFVPPLPNLPNLPNPAFCTPDFRIGLLDAPIEYITPTPCVVTGTLPAEVHGTLYRNGPAQFHVHGERIKHWFDGDGKVIAVHLDEAGATYQSRFVDTVARQKEQRQGRRLYGGLGGRPRGGLLGTLRGFLGKNVANTNVVFFGGKLLALYEGGRPYQLDPTTLRTLQEDDLGGVLQGNQAASAHPKLHTPSNALWSFKIQYGQKNTVQLYQTSATGVVTEHKSFALPYTTMLHDFCLTETQAVFVISPLVVPRSQLALYVLGIKPMHALPKLDPKAGSYVVTVPLSGDAPARLSRFDTPVMILHTVNAWDQDGGVVIDTCDFSAGQSLDLATAMMGSAPLARSMPKIRRLHCDAHGSVTTEVLGDTQLEFPAVAPHVMHKEHSKIYGVQWPTHKDYVGVPACYDLTTQCVEAAPMPAGSYASECVLIPKTGAQREDEVYLLTVVLDSCSQTSALHVYDGEDLKLGPIAQVQLPQAVPHGFHGSWVAKPSA